VLIREAVCRRGGSCKFVTCRLHAHVEGRDPRMRARLSVPIQRNFRFKTVTQDLMARDSSADHFDEMPTLRTSGHMTGLSEAAIHRCSDSFRARHHPGPKRSGWQHRPHRGDADYPCVGLLLDLLEHVAAAPLVPRPGCCLSMNVCGGRAHTIPVVPSYDPHVSYHERAFAHPAPNVAARERRR